MRPIILPKSSARKAAVIVVLFYVTVVMSGCNVNINVVTSEEGVEVPQEEMQVPQEDVEVPQEEMQVPQEDVEVPQEEMQVPQEEMQVPQEDVEVPQEEMQVPQEDVEVPQEEMQVPQEDVEVPQEKMQVPQEDVEVPQEKMQIPQEDVEVPQEKTDAGRGGWFSKENIQILLALIGILFPGGIATIHFRKNILNGAKVILNLLKGKEEKENIYIYFLKSSNDKIMQAQRDRLKSLGFNCVDDIKDISNNKLDVLQNLRDNAVYIVGYSDDYDYKKLLDVAKHKKSCIIFFAHLGEIKRVENLELINDGINNCDVAHTMNGLATSLSNLLKTS